MGWDTQCPRESLKESLRRLHDAGFDAAAANIFAQEHQLKIPNNLVPPDHDRAVCYLQVAVRELEAPTRATTWEGFAIPCACAVKGCRCTGLAEFFTLGEPVGLCDRHAKRYRFMMGSDYRKMRAVDLHERALPKGSRSCSREPQPPAS